MNAMEQQALHNVAEYLRYANSPQARIDAKIDATRRSAADRKAGHSPKCSLTRCAACCPQMKGGR